MTVVSKPFFLIFMVSVLNATGTLSNLGEKRKKEIYKGFRKSLLFCSFVDFFVTHRGYDAALGSKSSSSTTRVKNLPSVHL